MELHSILTLLGSGHQKTYHCRIYSRELLMMGKEVRPEHVKFYDRINFR